MLKFVKKGTELYLGHNASAETCPEQFLYEGQLASKKVYKYFVGYFTSFEDVANKYARCFGQNRGWVNKYRANRDFTLIDITDEFLHYEADEVEKEFCSDYGGYYIEWSRDADEYAICDPWNYLDYVNSKRCLKTGTFSEYICSFSKK